MKAMGGVGAGWEHLLSRPVCHYGRSCIELFVPFVAPSLLDLSCSSRRHAATLLCLVVKCGLLVVNLRRFDLVVILMLPSSFCL